jgi:ABC-2 type transport system ATP-binding protein
MIAGTDPSILQVSGLGIRFGKKPLFENLSLEIGKRQFVTLMGENGVGKTTFLETLMGYRNPSAGQIRFWGKRREELDPAWLFSRIAVVTSVPERYPAGLQIGEFLKILRSVYPIWNDVLVARLCRDFQLQLDKPLNHLSLGEHSKVRLVKALAFEPELLFLDELTANLSPPSKKAVLSALISVFERKEMSVLYVSHSQDEAVRLSDRILTLTPKGVEPCSHPVIFEG